MSNDPDRFDDDTEEENGDDTVGTVAGDDDDEDDSSVDDSGVDDVSTDEDDDESRDETDEDEDDRTVDVSTGEDEDDRTVDVSTGEDVGRRGDDAGPEPDTETGLEPNIAAALSYLFAPLTGILFYLLEPENEFVRFHSVQSIAVFGGIIVVGVAMTVLAAVLGLIPFVGWLGALLVLLASMFLPLIAVVLWILLIVKAYQGEEYAVPGFENTIRKYASTE